MSITDTLSNQLTSFPIQSRTQKILRNIETFDFRYNYLNINAMYLSSYTHII